MTCLKRGDLQERNRRKGWLNMKERDTNEVIKELREFEDLFFKSFRLSPLSITIIRIRDGLLIEVNKAFERITGYSREEAIGHTTFELGLWVDLKEREHVVQILLSEGSLRDEETHFFTKDRKRIVCQYSAEIIEMGNEPCALAMIIDITERKRAEEALLRANAYNRSLIEVSLDPLVTIGPDGKITDVNAATEAVTGYMRDQLIGTDFSDYFTDPEKARAGYEQGFRDGKVFDYALDLRHRDGQVKSVLYNAAVYRDEVGQVIGVFAAARDVTERKLAEEQLKRYSERLEDLVEERTRQLRDAERLAAIGETAVMIGHDLRDPLQVIVNTTYLARLKVDSLIQPEETYSTKQELFKDLITIEEQSDYMNKIVSDLQDYSRPLSPEMMDVALLPFVKKILSSQKKPVDIEVQMEIEGGLTWKIDITMMTRVLTNLISNAIQAMPQGGKLTIASTRTEGEVVLTIKDTGVGISPEIMPKLFEPLFTTKAKGMGFGLVVAKRLLEAQGGNLNINSEADKGTVVLIRMPYGENLNI
jgi:PAS domain S-box-containing protein